MMDSLRSLGAQCGEPTALSSLSSAVTAANMSVLADSNAYKTDGFSHSSGASGVSSSLAGESQLIPITTATTSGGGGGEVSMDMDLMNEFAHHHHAQPLIENIDRMQQDTSQLNMYLQDMQHEFEYKLAEQQHQQQQQHQHQMIPQDNTMNLNNTGLINPYMMSTTTYPQMSMSMPMNMNMNMLNSMYTPQLMIPSMYPGQIMRQPIMIKPNLPNGVVPTQVTTAPEKQEPQKETKPEEEKKEEKEEEIEREEEDEEEEKEPVADEDEEDDEAIEQPIPEYEFPKENEMLKRIQGESRKIDDEASRKEKEMEEIQKLMRQGKRWMKKGELPQAILSFETVVSLDPTHAPAWKYLGKCHQDNENDQLAITAYLKCHEQDPYDLDALLALGVSFTNRLNPDAALDYLRQWLANHPDYGILDVEDPPKENLSDEQACDMIGELFTRASKINENDPDLHTVLGVLYNLTAQYDKAALHFKKGLQARPKDPTLWNKLGATLANGDRCPEAIDAYHRALSLKPNYVRALSNLGIAFSNQDMHKEAARAWLATLRLNPKAEVVWEHLAYSFINLHRKDLVKLLEHRDVTLFEKHFDF